MSVLDRRVRVLFGGAATTLLVVGTVGCGSANPASGRTGARSTTPVAASSNTTYRWGAFDAGAPEQQADSPVAVGNLVGATAIAAANISDMALADGGVETWGNGAFGNLGQGDTSNHFSSAVPVSIPGSPTIVAIGESEDTDVAVTSGGQPYGWGRNHDGELCTGNTRQQHSPVEMTNLSDVKQVAGGGGHMVYLLDDGTVEGCGKDSKGQLGNGSTNNTSVPVKMDLSMLPSPVASISSGSNTTAVLLADGEVWECGDNNYGQLGNGTTDNADKLTQVRLPEGSVATAVYAGGNGVANGQALAILSSNAVYGWGDNQQGQLGMGTTSAVVKVPRLASALPSGHTWTAVATGADTSYALDSTGDVYAFGDDTSGQIGNGASGGSVVTPTLVLTGADMISATSDDTVAQGS
jgi:alpha-tubulin suppressor-like RCC1 family protein